MVSECCGSKSNVLFLGAKSSPLITWLQDQGETVFSTEDPVSVDLIIAEKIDFIVSYGYRHLIRKDVIELLPRKIVNLHISFLPWNRGADPNFWSVIDDTPKGVTIHLVDEGLDTGDIIEQRVVDIDVHKETLSSSYARLNEEIIALFQSEWKRIKCGNFVGKKQEGVGSFHKLKDKEALWGRLSLGWDTPMIDVKKLVLESQ